MPDVRHGARTEPERAVLVALLAWALQVQPAAADWSLPARLLDASQRLQAADLDPGRLAVLGAHADAMARYRLIQQQPGFARAYPFLPAGQDRRAQPWTWVAPDGSSITRLDQGLFRVSLADHHRNWYLDLDCHDAGWPTFVCSDGVSRKMSAPDLQTVTLDGMIFTRELPRNE